MDKECPRCKATPRSNRELKLLQNRLNRIIGQLGGVSKMLEENRYCGDILTQLAAAESALQSLGYIILQEHLKTCVREQIAAGDDEVINETFELFKKLK